MTERRNLLAGVYRHYKGPLYLVLGYGHDANADEFFAADESDRFTGGRFPEGRTVVVYVGLELEAAHVGGRLAVRTADDFHALVCGNDDTCDHYGTALDPISTSCSYCGVTGRPRFAYVSPTWEGQR